VRQLLLFSRRTPADFQRLDVNDVVAGVASMLARLVGPAITLRISREPAPWPVEGDASSLEHVILNLVTNARDAMPAGGEIEVETANRLAPAPMATAHGATPGRYVVVA